MTEHPITPPIELVQQWSLACGYSCPQELWNYIATQAARWGADQELEACKQVIIDQRWFAGPEFRLAQLHNARRPKPPSLKQQALDQLSSIQIDLTRCGMGISIDTIRRALNELPDE